MRRREEGLLRSRSRSRTNWFDDEGPGRLRREKKKEENVLKPKYVPEKRNGIVD
jgi:hypothetical protein